MSDRPALPWWHRLGRLLPADVRERVFEPACYERLRWSLENDRGAGLAVAAYAVAAFLGAAAFNFPRLWFDGWRPSALSKLLALFVLGAGGLLWALAMSRYVYAGY